MCSAAAGLHLNLSDIIYTKEGVMVLPASLGVDSFLNHGHQPPRKRSSSTTHQGHPGSQGVGDRSAGAFLLSLLHSLTQILERMCLAVLKAREVQVVPSPSCCKPAKQPHWNLPTLSENVHGCSLGRPSSSAQAVLSGGAGVMGSSQVWPAGSLVVSCP